MAEPHSAQETSLSQREPRLMKHPLQEGTPDPTGSREKELSSKEIDQLIFATLYKLGMDQESLLEWYPTFVEKMHTTVALAQEGKPDVAVGQILGYFEVATVFFQSFTSKRTLRTELERVLSAFVRGITAPREELAQLLAEEPVAAEDRFTVEAPIDAGIQQAIHAAMQHLADENFFYEAQISHLESMLTSAAARYKESLLRKIGEETRCRSEIEGIIQALLELARIYQGADAKTKEIEKAGKDIVYALQRQAAALRRQQQESSGSNDEV